MHPILIFADYKVAVGRELTFSKVGGSRLKNTKFYRLANAHGTHASLMLDNDGALNGVETLSTEQHLDVIVLSSFIPSGHCRAL